MEFIGFVFIVILAVILMCYGCMIFLAQITLGASKKGDTLAMFISLGLACWLFYWIYHNSPFTVSIK